MAKSPNRGYRRSTQPKTTQYESWSYRMIVVISRYSQSSYRNKIPELKARILILDLEDSMLATGSQ